MSRAALAGMKLGFRNFVSVLVVIIVVVFRASPVPVVEPLCGGQLPFPFNPFVRNAHPASI